MVILCSTICAEIDVIDYLLTTEHAESGCQRDQRFPSHEISGRSTVNSADEVKERNY